MLSMSSSKPRERGIKVGNIEALAKYIRELRERKGVSQEAVAVGTHLDRVSISAIETKGQQLTLENLLNLEIYFNLVPGTLYAVFAGTLPISQNPRLSIILPESLTDEDRIKIEEFVGARLFDRLVGREFDEVRAMEGIREYYRYMSSLPAPRGRPGNNRPNNNSSNASVDRPTQDELTGQNTKE